MRRNPGSLFCFAGVCGKRHLEPEGTAVARRTFNAVGRSVSLKYLLDDRKSESGTDDRAFVDAVDLIIPVPDARKLFGGYPLSVIGYRYAHSSVKDRLFYLDQLIVSCVIQGIVYKGLYDLQESCAVAVNENIGIGGIFDPVSVLFGQLAVAVHR